MAGLFPDIEGPALEGLKARLNLLGASPPQVLLLDGGSEPQRLAMARYWACRCNCPSATEEGPCLACAVCTQIAQQENLDVLAFDGRISNREDEEAPGPVRALSMDNIRALKGLLKDPPHGRGMRVVLLMGLERTRSGAANALLKALEEPSATSLFVLLAAQREQLLPTLVSRSHCLTLPWPDPEAEPEDSARGELVADLEEFFRSGRRLMTRTAARGYDVAQAQMTLDIVRKSLLRVLAGRPAANGLDISLALLPEEVLGNASRWIGEANDRLQAQVTPARVIDALMTRLYLLLPRGGRQGG